eukprot:TRINITY_DN6165_c0_g1_i1.p1 TRINITY_DN6165_c0_g1~~TRINITY_DN6165_c0_g1_i1.p1  ORF type:complete len:244 (-),score=53.51 TRINITY_DN6165_c0_g1_i1:40-771(-)
MISNILQLLLVELNVDENVVISGACDRLVKIGYLDTGKVITVSGPQDWITCMKYSKKLKMCVVGSTDKTIRVYSNFLHEEDPYHYASHHKALIGHSNWVNRLALREESALLISGGSDNSVILWDLNTLSKLMVLEGHTDWINGVDFIPVFSKDLAMSVDASGCVCIWDIKTGALLYHMKDHLGSALSMLTSNRYLVTTSWDNSTVVYDFNTDVKIVPEQETKPSQTRVRDPNQFPNSRWRRNN